MPLFDVVSLHVWNVLWPYLPAGTVLTSAYRSAEYQLSFIVRKAKENGYKFTCKAALIDRSSWIGALEFLRGKGYYIAEPHKSMHHKGVAFDFTGPNLQKIKAAILKAVADRKITLWWGSKSNLKIEPSPNNCVHVEIQMAILDYDPLIHS